jgi:hypothetical protein
LNIKKLLYLPLIIGLAGSVLIASGLWQVWNAKNSVNWQRTQGRVLSSAVSQTSSKSLRSTLTIAYEYTVNGIVFHGDRMAYSQAVNHEIADSILMNTRYFSGAAVDVYYDPSSPGRAVLIPGSKQQLEDFSSMISGGFILLVAWVVHSVKHNPINS